MGRVFSTIYHTIFVALAITALVFTIISATSCAFVKFDHQYSSSGRLLTNFQLDNEHNNNRVLQDDKEDDVDVDEESMQGLDMGLPADMGPPDDVDVSGVDEDAAETATTTVEDEDADTVPADTLGDVPNEEPVVDAADVAESSTAAGDDASDIDVADLPEDISVPEVDLDVTPQSVMEDASGSDVEDAEVVDVGVDFSAPVTESSAPADDEDATEVDYSSVTDPENTSSDISGMGSTSSNIGTGSTETGPGKVSITGSGSSSSGSTQSGPGKVSIPGSSGKDTIVGTSGSSSIGSTQQMGDSYGASSNNTSASKAAIQMSGTSGLFCESEKDFQFSSLWGGGKDMNKLEELENEIAIESDMNQSEELARNAAIVALIFGLLAAIILLLESVLGWTICCEKVIVGSLALMACISQGVTFLYFNSERYCDGDIINEILNQKPCVMGQGGWYSVGALILYAIMFAMSCALPQDDPHGFFCKGRDSKETAGFGMLGSSVTKNENGENGNPENGKPQQPNWLSEESKPTVDEENEII